MPVHEYLIAPYPKGSMRGSLPRAFLRLELALVFLEEERVIVGVKTGGSRVGGPDLCVKDDGNKKQGTQMFTQVRALSMEVKPYFLLD